jgi:hypothetical protein
MPAKHRPPPKGRKFFTPAQANKMLPLVSAITRDIVALHTTFQEGLARVHHLQAAAEGGELPAAGKAELDALVTGLEKDRDQLRAYLTEMQNLGLDFKGGPGLVDFPAWVDGREIYLCWQMGEPAVTHWHEIDAGFAGRQKLPEAEAAPAMGSESCRSC